jgi:flavodoxin
MKAAVIFESWFGNTHKVAEAIAAELRRDGDVVLLSVDDLPPRLHDLDLLVVGAPTHIHGLSTAMSRRSALEQRGEAGEAGIGVRGWVRELPIVDGVRAAAFDTRFERSVVVTGSAARGIAKRLRRRGFELAAPPESFFVDDSEGPLKEGELDRAANWARSLVTARAEARV